MPHPPSDPNAIASIDERRLSRRTMIKRAAATGAVAWTAPVIIDSLASPAAAGSVAGPCSVFVFKITRNNGNSSCASSQPTCSSTSYSGATLCTNYGGAPNGPSITTTDVKCTETQVYTVTGTNCGIVGTFQSTLAANSNSTCPSSVGFTTVDNLTSVSLANGLETNNTSRYVFIAVNCSP